MDISSALKSLRNATTKDLQNHKIEAVAAFREIEARLGGFESLHHEAVEEAACVQLRSSVEQPVISDEVAKPTNPIKLLAALNKASAWVRQSIKLQPRQVLSIKRQLARDRRLADVRRVEGDFNAENQYKLLRGLAQRSLALQGESSGHLDIEQLCNVASSRGNVKANKGRRGKMSSYVKYELGIEAKDKDFAIRAIQAGMRQLVMERLLRKRFEETGQCDSEQCDIALGISAFTALTVRPFRCLKYEEIPEFLDCLLEPASMNLLVSEDEQIADILKETSIWYNKLQIYYDKQLVGIDTDLDTDSPGNDYTPSSIRLSDQPTKPAKAAMQSAIISPQSYLNENGGIHSEEASDSSDEVSDTSESTFSESGSRTADNEGTSNNTSRSSSDFSVSSTGLACSRPSGTSPYPRSTEETGEARRKRRRISSHTDFIRHIEFHPTNPAQWVPVPPTTQRGPSDPHNAIDAYLHSCGPQLDNVHLASSAADHERTIFNPMASDAIFSLFSDPLLNDVQLDSTTADHERTIFNPMASDAIFSLYSDPQLDNVRLGNVQLDNVQLDSTTADHERTIFNPMASDAIFSLYSDPQLDNVQLDSTTADHERTIFNPMASDAVFSLYSDPQLDNVQLGNVQLDNVQLDSTTADHERTIFNPMASDAVFSLYSDPQLDNVQLDSIAETDQKRTRYDQSPSDGLCRPFSNSPLYSTTAQVGFNSSEVDSATSEVF
ncbi:hypothetical protein N7505_007781 [Penicillium chrysogenum]|uniref:Uncharacterized protein n=1 Tax=Penicillium chrysogenum TaxID=5076 RepID=A0ABQ8WFQ0_PENCH|nr:hypothetical protein N7505_007781 [Penicillium chrysogenum]